MTPQTFGLADHAAPPATDLVDGTVVEPKVRAATVAAVLVTFVLWALSAYVFRGDVPLPVQGLVELVAVGGVTFAAGWRARHVDRAPAAT
jgi:hypothetical protein